MRAPVLLAVLLVAAPRAGPAQQAIGFDPLRGEVSLSMRGQWTDTEAATFASSRTLFEGVSLRGGGHVLRPELVRFDFTLAPRFSQSRFENEPEIGSYPNTSRDGQLYGVVEARLLPMGFLGLDLSASRRRIDLLDRTGRQRDRDYGQYGVSLQVRGRALPTRVYARWESDAESWAAEPVDRPLYDQDRTRVGIEARNSKTQLFVENLTSRDRLDGRDFTYLNSRLSNRQRWGKGSQLNSRLTFTRREQFGLTQKLLLLDETVRLQHTRALSSDYRFSVGNQSRGPAESRTLLGELGARYAVAPPLTLTLDGRVREQTFDGGAASISQRRILPGASLTLRPAHDLSFRAGGQVGYQWGRFDGTSGVFGQVVGERHVVGSDLTVPLREDRIDVATIVVRSIDGSLDLLLDQDYSVSVVGLRTELILLPGGRVGEGESISVDYLYAVVAEDNFDGAVVNYMANLGYRGLSAYHTRFLETNAEVMIGTEGRLAAGSDYLVTGASFQTKGHLGALNLRFEHIATERRFIRSSGVRATAIASTFLGPRILGTLTGSWYSGKSEEQVSKLLRGEARLDWRPARGLLLTGQLLGYDSRFDSRTQSHFGGGLGTELEWRALRFTARVERGLYQDSSRPDRDRLQTRLWAGVSRTF